MRAIRSLDAIRGAACLLLAFLLAAAFASCSRDETYQIGFSKRLPDPAKVKQRIEKDRLELGEYAPSGAEKELAAAFTDFNRMLTGKPPDPRTIETKIKNLQNKAKLAYDQDGRPKIRKLCLWLLKRFSDSLDKLIAVSAKTDGIAKALANGAAPSGGEAGRAFDEFAAAGGDFLRHAVSAGLIAVPAKGGLKLEKESAFFVRLAFKVRFAQIFPDEDHPLDWLLNDFERRWYYIWVVERSQTASMLRKLDAIEKLRSLEPGYSDVVARGIVHFQNAKYGIAMIDFQQALKSHPGDARLKSFLAAARQQVKKNPPQKKPLKR